MSPDSVCRCFSYKALICSLILASANGPSGSNKRGAGLYVLYWASYRAGALITPRVTNAHACLLYAPCFHIPLVSVFVRSRSWASWVNWADISCVWCDVTLFMISQAHPHNAFRISIQLFASRVHLDLKNCYFIKLA